MKISIITPTLNSIKYLSRCYKSVFEFQNYKNIEWIIVDGGSKDGTIEFLKNLNNPAIKIYSENSNHLVKHITMEYKSFWRHHWYIRF